MDTEISKEFATFLTSITAVLAGILGILKYFQYRTRRDKIMLVRQAFESVVKSLASNIEVERMAGAILLRRFFDPDTEVGISRLPYWKKMAVRIRRFFHSKTEVDTASTPLWKEAVDVTAAILRGQRTGNFQKLLADGLAFAPSLERADLQRTNLQFAYLGSRKKASSPLVQVTTDLSYADFYRADLSGASLKGAFAQGAVFYQARMHNTVLKSADLREANFFEADLKGARFDKARLSGADFTRARNIPFAVARKLNHKNKYGDEEEVEESEPGFESQQIRVFMSKPGLLDYQQQQYVSFLRSRLEAEGMIPQTIERNDYPQFEAIGEVQRLMSDCSGAVIFGFKQLEVRDGLWRSSTPEEKPIKDHYLSTPWNQIEAGMAAMLALPIFVVCQRGVDGGIFDMSLGGHQIYRVLMDEDWDATVHLNSFADWCADVRERSGFL
jgi:hypothetical protein